MKKRNVTGTAGSATPIELEDSNREDMFEHYVMGVICLVAAGAIFHYGQPMTLQISSPDFNPLLVILIAALVYAGFNFFRAIRRTVHHRLYGTSSLILEAPPQLGKSLVGEIRTAMNLLPDHRVHYRLRCVERRPEKSYGDTSSNNSLVDDVLWETREIREGLGSDKDNGIPVNLYLPEDAIPKRNNTINPGEIRWILEVTVEGSPYAAAFGLQVAAADRVKPTKKSQRKIEKTF